MKTLRDKDISQEWLNEEYKRLDQLRDRSRSKEKFASLHPLLIGGTEYSEESDISDLITKSECLMLMNNEAEWVRVNNRRHFKASPRVIAWALTVIEKKSEDLFIRISTDLSKIEEWEYWKRISLEFDEKEYKALIKILSKNDQRKLERSQSVQHNC